MKKKYLHAEYPDAEAVARAVEALEKAGFAKSSLEMYSRKPVETHPPLLPRKSRMSLVAVLSAIAAGGGMTAFMFYTQMDYPLVTGGMPITSGWATGVITYEMTLFMLLWEGGLIGHKNLPPAPDLPDEGIVLQVSLDERPPEEAESVLRETGGTNLETLEKDA